MCHELNDRNRRLRAFVLPIGKLDSPVHLIERILVLEVQSVPGNEAEDPQRLQTDLERLRHRGRLVLLFDGLDMANDDSVQALAQLLEPRSEWSRCRIVVAGRPFALERHWDRLFEGGSWQFVQIAEFNSKQQRAALGKIDGRDRYDLIPPEARNILTTPRVLEYFHDAYVAFLGDCGHPLHRVLAERRWAAPLSHAEADYLRPIRFGDALDAQLVRARVEGSTLTVGYRLAAADGQAIVAVGVTVHVFVDPATFRRCDPPADLAAAFNRLAGS